MIPVLHADKRWIVIDKPEGLMMHANAFDREGPFLADLLEVQLGYRPLTVNRLDRPVGGLMVLALDAETAARLGVQFAGRTVEKNYTALVRGHVADETFCEREVPKKKGGERKPSRSVIRCVERYILEESLGAYPESWFSLVDISLLTGRRHQARVHMKSLRSPIIGDRAYGDRQVNRNFALRFGTQSLFLRSTRLCFDDPDTGIRQTFETGIPGYWKDIISAMKLVDKAT